MLVFCHADVVCLCASCDSSQYCIQHDYSLLMMVEHASCCGECYYLERIVYCDVVNVCVVCEFWV